MDAFEEDTNPFRSDSDDVSESPFTTHSNDDSSAFNAFHQQDPDDHHGVAGNGPAAGDDDDDDEDDDGIDHVQGYNDDHIRRDNAAAASHDFGNHTQSSGFQESEAATSVPSVATNRSIPAPPVPPTSIPRVPAVKTEFCCGRDQFLHSGEGAEILVSISYFLKPCSSRFCLPDRGCRQDERELVLTLYRLCNTNRGMSPLSSKPLPSQ